MWTSHPAEPTAGPGSTSTTASPPTATIHSNRPELPAPDQATSPAGISSGRYAAFGGDLPRDWLPCDGRTVPLNRYQPLWAAIGTRFGGDGETTLGLPDLRGRATAGTDSRRKQDVGDTSGLGTPPPKLLPFVVVNWGIRSFGDFPERGR